LKQLSSLIQRFISYLESSSIRGIKYKKTDTKETTEKNTVTKQSPTPQNPQTSPMFA